MYSKSKHSSFYRNTIWQYGLQIIRYLFPLITLPYLTRVLEPKGYAVYAYVSSFMTFVQIFVDFGFNLSGTELIARAKSVSEENEMVGAIMQARLLLCGVAFIAVSIISLCIPILKDNFFYAELAYVAVCGRAMAPDFLFQGHENMKPITTRYFISKGISTALTFVLVHSISDILWVPILDTLSSCIALAWSFIVAWKMFRTTATAVSMSRAMHELRVSGLYCFSNMSAAVFSGFTTLLIGVVITDASQISYWSLAITAVSAIQMLYEPITNSLYPHMVKTKDFEFIRKIALLALPVVITGTIAFALLSNVVMIVLGGKAYLAGSWVVAAVSPVLVFSFFGILFGWPTLGAAGKIAEITQTTVFSALFCIASLLLAAFLGIASMGVICAIRCGTEALLLLQRFIFSRELIFKTERVSNSED